MIRLLLSVVCLAAMVLPSMAEDAQWEQCLKVPEAYSIFRTSKGTLLVSSWDENGKGGIYRSTDHGDSWEKNRVRYKKWHEFIEVEDSLLFIGGTDCSVARSDDDGETWLILSYKKVIEKYCDEKELPYVETEITYDPDRRRLYVDAQNSNGGVIYSDDFGETWTMTNRNGLTINWGDGTGDVMDSVYGMVYFKNRMYVLGLVAMKAYDADRDRWTNVSTKNSCASTHTIHKGALYLGHAMMIEPGYLLKYTTDGKTWKTTPEDAGRSESKMSYVRALHSDGDRLYYGYYCNAVRYSNDDAQTWHDLAPLSPGFAFYTSLTSDDKYVYMVAYNYQNPNLGIFRFPKDKLAGSGVDAVATDGTGVRMVDGVISAIDDKPMQISVFDASGRVADNRTVWSYDTAVLAPGIYTYRAVVSGKVATGKFMVR